MNELKDDVDIELKTKPIIRKTIVKDYTTAEALCPECQTKGKFVGETQKSVYDLEVTYQILYSNFQCRNKECGKCFTSNPKTFKDRQMFTEKLLSFVNDLKWNKCYSYRRIKEILWNIYQLEISVTTLYNYCCDNNPLKKNKFS